MSRLGCDDDSSTTAGDDLAELFQHERRTVKIDLEDRFQRSLREGDTGSVKETGDVAQAGGLLGKRMNGVA